MKENKGRRVRIGSRIELPTSRDDVGASVGRGWWKPRNAIARCTPDRARIHGQGLSESDPKERKRLGSDFGCTDAGRGFVSGNV